MVRFLNSSKILPQLLRISPEIQCFESSVNWTHHFSLNRSALSNGSTMKTELELGCIWNYGLDLIFK